MSLLVIMSDPRMYVSVSESTSVYTAALWRKGHAIFANFNVLWQYITIQCMRGCALYKSWLFFAIPNYMFQHIETMLYGMFPHTFFCKQHCWLA